jgi:hypothetical protein
MNAENKTLPYGEVKTCRECLKPLGGYERAFYQIYEGRCTKCHERLMAPADMGYSESHAAYQCKWNYI